MVPRRFSITVPRRFISVSLCALTHVVGCVCDVDMCDGNRIDRPQYVGHCSNRQHHRPDTCKETGDRYELVFRWKMTDIQTNQGHRQTDRLTIVRVSSVKIGRTRNGKCTNTQTMLCGTL